MTEEITEEEIQAEILEQIKQDQEDDSSEAQEDSIVDQANYSGAYGESQAEQSLNPSSFLHKAAFESDNALRTTFLTETELGRPLFSVRFLLDLHNISNHYLNPIISQMKKEKEVEIENKIANYFAEKIKNITGSGMSNEGFAMNLNVTKKVDSTRRRSRDTSNLKQFQQN
jgi:hypothetical protein